MVRIRNNPYLFLLKPAIQDDGGRVPLHWATAHGHLNAVKVLLESGAGHNDMANVKDKEGWNPLHRACQQPPPKEKPRAQNNNEEGASNEEKPGTLSKKKFDFDK